MGKILHKLFLLVHWWDSGKRFFCDVGTCYLHCNFVVSLFHLYHVNQLAEKVLVKVEYIGTITTATGLYLLVMKVEHLVDETGCISVVFIRLLTDNNFSQLFQFDCHICLSWFLHKLNASCIWSGGTWLHPCVHLSYYEVKTLLRICFIIKHELTSHVIQLE